MPLPSDAQVVQTSKDLVSQLQGIAGKHPGFRPAHAKGLLLSGTFSPSSEAAKLSSAPHFNHPSTPLTVRFSDSTGVPQIPDNDPNADPRGCAIRFNLGEHKHTDVVSHSTPFFPTRTGAEFLEFLRAVVASATSKDSPSPIEAFLGSHPAALAFVQAPKPPPSSFAREAYFSVTAFKFINTEGKETYIRYQVVPEAGVETLDASTVKEKDSNYLFDELKKRLQTEGSISFRLLAQLAEDGDVVDDATVHWPETRKVVELGSVKLDTVMENNPAEQKRIIFDPIPRVQGIEASADPLLEIRAGVYLISGRERRAAKLEGGE